MTNKEKYKKLCIKEKSIPIFSQYWWMDAVCGEENWDVILVENGEGILGALPYYFRKIRGRIYIDQPMLTSKNGVWIKYPEGQRCTTRLKYEKKIIYQIIAQLESLKLGEFNQNFDYSFTNWIPFYFKTFRGSVRYTNVIENIENIDVVYKNFETQVRNNIKNTSKLLRVKEDLDIEKFYDINKKTFNRQNVKIPYSLDFIKRLDDACAQHNCRKIFYAETNSGEICAVNYIVWDENAAYSLMAGEVEKFRSYQADTLLIWESIKFCSDKTKNFDFEGSMIEGVEVFIRNFGASLKPYFNISKSYSFRSILKLIARDLYISCPGIKKIGKRLKHLLGGL